MVLRSAPAFAGYVGGRSRALQKCQPLCGGPVCQPPRLPTPSHHQEACTAVLCAELPPKASSRLPPAILRGLHRPGWAEAGKGL